MTKEQFAQLLDKYASGTCTTEEKLLLELWLDSLPDAERKELQSAERLQMWVQIENRIVESEQMKRPYFKRWIPYAAAAILAICCSLLLLKYYTVIQQNTLLVQQDSINPGSDQAILTLSDGTKVSLDSNSSQIAAGHGITISKNADGRLQYHVTAVPSDKIGFNTIETPRGGRYEIVLSDGTQVLLNASSSLRFPVNLYQEKDRKVELKGEGYFAVAKDKSHPFVVKAGQQDIRVLGTEFNVNTYNTNRSYTTLIEGSVLINGQYKLKPGQQAIADGSGVTIAQVETAEFIDWKNNLFIFRNEALSSILERVSRWYDVDILYNKADSKSIRFNGEISRYADVREVLSLLEKASDVKFEIIKKTIVVK